MVSLPSRRSAMNLQQRAQLRGVDEAMGSFILVGMGATLQPMTGMDPAEVSSRDVVSFDRAMTNREIYAAVNKIMASKYDGDQQQADEERTRLLDALFAEQLHTYEEFTTIGYIRSYASIPPTNKLLGMYFQDGRPLVHAAAIRQVEALVESMEKGSPARQEIEARMLTDYRSIISAYGEGALWPQRRFSKHIKTAPVIIAALHALATLGNKDDQKALLNLLNDLPSVRQAAKATLRQLNLYNEEEVFRRDVHASKISIYADSRVDALMDSARYVKEHLSASASYIEAVRFVFTGPSKNIFIEHGAITSIELAGLPAQERLDIYEYALSQRPELTLDMIGGGANFMRYEFPQINVLRAFIKFLYDNHLKLMPQGLGVSSLSDDSIIEALNTMIRDPKYTSRLNAYLNSSRQTLLVPDDEQEYFLGLQRTINPYLKGRGSYQDWPLEVKEAHKRFGRLTLHYLVPQFAPKPSDKILGDASFVPMVINLFALLQDAFKSSNPSLEARTRQGNVLRTAEWVLRRIGATPGQLYDLYFSLLMKHGGRFDGFDKFIVPVAVRFPELPKK